MRRAYVPEVHPAGLFQVAGGSSFPPEIFDLFQRDAFGFRNIEVAPDDGGKCDYGVEPECSGWIAQIFAVEIDFSALDRKRAHYFEEGERNYRIENPNRKRA